MNKLKDVKLFIKLDLKDAYYYLRIRKDDE
jgi:hypothetical protein